VSARGLGTWGGELNPLTEYRYQESLRCDPREKWHMHTPSEAVKTEPALETQPAFPSGGQKGGEDCLEKVTGG